MTRYYLAKHSCGTTHLCSTKNASGFSHAVVQPRLGACTFHGSEDEATERLQRLSRWHAQAEVVRAVEISRDEHGVAVRQNKNLWSVSYGGQTWTRSKPVDLPRLVAAVGWSQTLRRPIKGVKTYADLRWFSDLEKARELQREMQARHDKCWKISNVQLFELRQREPGKTSFNSIPAAA